jgi:hypothetical protein
MERFCLSTSTSWRRLHTGEMISLSHWHLSCQACPTACHSRTRNKHLQIQQWLHQEHFWSAITVSATSKQHQHAMPAKSSACCMILSAHVACAVHTRKSCVYGTLQSHFLPFVLTCQASLTKHVTLLLLLGCAGLALEMTLLSCLPSSPGTSQTQVKQHQTYVVHAN